VGEAATVCEEFKTKPRSGFGLNELLGRTLARKVSARQCCSWAEARTAGARLAELRAHPENHGMEPTDSGVLELRAHPWLPGRAARRQPKESTSVASHASTRRKPLLALLTCCGLTPELSRAAKRLRLE